MWSSTRPGVPTIRSTPRAKARICFSIGSPPKMPQTATWDPIASFCNSATICCVSSRVGASTIACGPRARASSISNQRNPERGGLACARFGLADDVETFESFRDKSRLDGGGRQVAAVLESLKHRVAQAHATGTRQRAPQHLVESINPPGTFVCQDDPLESSSSL